MTVAMLNLHVQHSAFNIMALGPCALRAGLELLGSTCQAVATLVQPCQPASQCTHSPSVWLAWIGAPGLQTAARPEMQQRQRLQVCVPCQARPALRCPGCAAPTVQRVLRPQTRRPAQFLLQARIALGDAFCSCAALTSGVAGGVLALSATIIWANWQRLGWRVSVWRQRPNLQPW